MKKTSAGIMCCVLAAILAGCGGGSQSSASAPAAPAAAKIVIKFGNNGNTDPAEPQNIAMEAFKKKLEESSKNAIEVQLYPAGQLGDARTQVESVQMGTLEMADIENGPMGGFVPQAMIWDLPYLYRDLDHAHRVADGTVGDQLKKLFLEKNIRVLAFNDGGFRYFTNSKRPIKTPADMKGMKIRVMESKIMIETINGFGATAVPMAFGELYTALQQGTVDGQENPFNLIYSQKFFEVQKYLSLTEHFYYPRQYLISENFYKGLSEEHKKLINSIAVEACGIQRSEYAKSVQRFFDVLKEKGMQANEVDKAAFQKISLPIYPKFYASVGGGDEAAGKALIEAVIATK
ncbi:MAG: DctP family TRAP transporter solute-binding subunit [Spirochaetales bacterium]|nr:DctP family TRAP transporter solute-binding subunit [Spirochaetales bacterium]